ncbi:bifunctional homocysteine S-methyltransferase/5,10-methylenetetrahydrofolate reductase [Oxobacter pfennigii]|uniref:Methylenetetrahydrofolate reductase n=1 Tax=Oxobacter pfennigii TaxID=36849 RepID=A0A0P8YFY0_9CLOT|nr:methylenetetrahydrofolate reductase C-terminal domain-containing protein [Oxobacter pfennigii]KPU45967.1 bifunctional homocysteine S-methyltransferase/5,10-methylenetetrahydrofolate reductase [Oxobacter pfennigii]
MDSDINKFKESLFDKSKMSVTWELVPGRGANEKTQEAVIENAKLAAKGQRIHALTLTDNPGGVPAITPEGLASEVIKLGIEPLVHFTCKDKNRNELEGLLYSLDRTKVRNILVMTGDYVYAGFLGRPKPVFDLEPMHVLMLLEEMNKGLEYKGIRGIIKHNPSDFFAGAVCSPFKQTEAETMVQYYKLKMKISSGAKYIVSQIGYDARKIHELLLFINSLNLNIPVIGNIYVLSHGTAKLMNKNRIPGVIVTDKLLSEIENESYSPDKGAEAKLLRCAKLYAIMKGMGYAGVHIGGHGIRYEDVEYIIDKGEELSGTWMDFLPQFDYPIRDGFYYFEKDEKTGLNRDAVSERRERPLDTKVELVYPMSKIVHSLMLEPGTPLWKPMRAICKAIEDTPLEEPFHFVEHISKTVLYHCKDCGDCALPDVAYVCPMSQCPKQIRNGICGGSYLGWCEVYPFKKKCEWVRAYARLKNSGKTRELDHDVIPPCNYHLTQTSSWINLYLGRDHNAKKYGVEPVHKKIH